MNVLVSKLLHYGDGFTKASLFMQPHLHKLYDTDLLVILFLAFVLVIASVTLGRSRLIVILLSIYGSAYTYSRFSISTYDKNIVPGLQDYWFHIAIFFVVFLFFFIILDKIMSNKVLGDSSLIPAIIIATVTAIFFLSIVLSGAQFIYQRSRFEPYITKYIITKNAQLFWTILPICTLALVTKRHKQRKMR